MSSSRNNRYDPRRQGSSARNLDFQNHPKPTSQFANMFSNVSETNRPYQPLPLTNQQQSHQQDHPQPTSQFANMFSNFSEPNRPLQQQSYPQDDYQLPLPQFVDEQPFTQLLQSQQQPFSQPTQPSSFFQTPEENAYNEQRHHFHTTQSEYRTPETDVTGRGKKGKQRVVAEEVCATGFRKTWLPWEDVILARCWCNKTDTTYDTREAKYWADITDMYNQDVTAKGGVPRETKSLQNRWHKHMRPQGTNYVAAYKKVMSNVKSGENQAKTLERVKKQYTAASPKNEKFQFEHVIDILMNCQKFCATSTTGSYPTMDNVNLEEMTTPQGNSFGSETPQSEQNSNKSSGKRKSTSESATDDVDEVSSPAKSMRPEGVKKRKMKAKRRLADVPEHDPHEVELEDRKMRSLELEFENSRLDHHIRTRKLKERQLTLQMLSESIADAETPEKIAYFKSKREWYVEQWMQEDGAQ